MDDMRWIRQLIISGMFISLVLLVSAETIIDLGPSTLKEMVTNIEK